MNWLNWLREPGCFVVVVTLLIAAFAFYNIGGQQQCNMLLGGAMTYLVQGPKKGKAPTEDRS